MKDNLMTQGEIKEIALDRVNELGRAIFIIENHTKLIEEMSKRYVGTNELYDVVTLLETKLKDMNEERSMLMDKHSIK